MFLSDAGSIERHGEVKEYAQYGGDVDGSNMAFRRSVHHVIWIEWIRRCVNWSTAYEPGSVLAGVAGYFPLSAFGVLAFLAVSGWCGYITVADTA